MITYVLGWFGGNAVLAIGTGVAALLSLTGAVVATRRYRKRRSATKKRELKRSVKAMKAARAATPKGQKRAARRAEPLNLVAGRKRPTDDPRLPRTRRAAKAVVARAKTARANRAAAKTARQPAKPALGLVAGPEATARSHDQQLGQVRCLAINATDEQQCSNSSVLLNGEYPGYCYLPNHRRQVCGAGKQSA